MVWFLDGGQPSKFVLLKSTRWSLTRQNMKIHERNRYASKSHENLLSGHVVHLFDASTMPPMETTSLQGPFVPTQEGHGAFFGDSKTQAKSRSLSIQPAQPKILETSDPFLSSEASIVIPATTSASPGDTGSSKIKFLKDTSLDETTTHGPLCIEASTKLAMPEHQTSSPDSPANQSAASFSNSNVSIKGAVHMVLEVCHGTLRDKVEGICLSGESPKVIFAEVVKTLICVSEGIKQLNSGGIQHGDVTWEKNFFAIRGRKVVPVLGDFGLANHPKANDLHGVGFVLYDVCNEILSNDDDDDYKDGQWDAHKWDLEESKRIDNNLPADWAGRLCEKAGWFEGFDEILLLILDAAASDNYDYVTVSMFQRRLEAVWYAMQEMHPVEAKMSVHAILLAMTAMRSSQQEIPLL